MRIRIKKCLNATVILDIGDVKTPDWEKIYELSGGIEAMLRLPDGRILTGYPDGSLIFLESTTVPHTQVMEVLDKTEAYIQQIATLTKEERGIRWYTQSLHYNIHYIVIVKTGYVCEQDGYKGEALFKQLVTMSEEERITWEDRNRRIRRALEAYGRGEGPLDELFAREGITLPEEPDRSV
jgi:hypothetical protein